MNKKTHFYIALGACFIIILAFACKTLIEPDIWWQITTGEWILKNHQVPKTDMLSFTFAGEPWVNIKWLAEVIMYLIASYTSPEMIYFFLGLLYIPLIFFCYKNYTLLFKSDINKYSFSFIFSCLICIITISHRINGRPEVFSYFFASLFLFIFIHASKNKYYLIGLIPLQIIWCNTHEAYGVGLVMIIIYTISELLWGQSSSKIFILSIALLSIGGIALNPIGTKIFSYTINIFTQLDKNKFTSELLDYTSSEYWDLFSTLNIITFIISSIFCLQLAKQSKWNLKTIQEKLPIYYILLLLAFFYLSLKSNRNIPLFQLISLPVYANALSKLKNNLFHESKMSVAITLSIAYLSIITGVFYSTFDKHNEFGLGVSPKYNPIGATNFLAKQTNNSKVFSDFLCSNYPLYHLRPSYKSYIDLRDLDVFPAKFFENCLYLYQAPNTMISSTQTIWQLADSIDRFQYVLLVNQPDFTPLHQELHRGNLFHAVYADANTSLYKRNDSTMIHTPIDSFYHDYSFYKKYNLSIWINHILNPFHKKIDERDYNFEEQKEIYQENYM